MKMKSVVANVSIWGLCWLFCSLNKCTYVHKQCSHLHSERRIHYFNLSTIKPDALLIPNNFMFRSNCSLSSYDLVSIVEFLPLLQVPIIQCQKVGNTVLYTCCGPFQFTAKINYFVFIIPVLFYEGCFQRTHAMFVWKAINLVFQRRVIILNLCKK